MLLGAAGSIFILSMLCEYLPGRWVPQLSVPQLRLVTDWTETAKLSKGSLQCMLLRLFSYQAGLMCRGLAVGSQGSVEHPNQSQERAIVTRWTGWWRP